MADHKKSLKKFFLVPKDHIVGKPLFVFFSYDKNKPWYQAIRWDRFFHLI
ncbi:MAG: hypothetical protein ACLFQO_20085 [Cyclobacteriaceae bacterium]